MKTGLENITSIFEPQLNILRTDSCGAACLAMALRKLNVDIDQSDINQNVNFEVAGRLQTSTRAMTRFALAMGVGALAIQTHRPWQTLNKCWSKGLVVIVNYRSNMTTNRGHYALVNGLNQQNILLHDPGLGPNKSFERTYFEELWLPGNSHRKSEISGNVLIALGRFEFESGIAAHCKTMFPDEATCQNCGHSIRLFPKSVLGCLLADCPERNWHRIYCPRCDFGMTPGLI